MDPRGSCSGQTVSLHLPRLSVVECSSLANAHPFSWRGIFLHSREPRKTSSRAANNSNFIHLRRLLPLTAITITPYSALKGVVRMPTLHGNQTQGMMSNVPLIVPPYHGFWSFLDSSSFQYRRISYEETSSLRGLRAEMRDRKMTPRVISVLPPLGYRVPLFFFLFPPPSQVICDK